MPLSVEVRLLTGRYDAARADDSGVAEWPPHPARLFSALVAAAQSSGDWKALRWLEVQEPPDVEASPLVDDMIRRSYVVTNRVESGGGSQSHPGRTNQLRTRWSASPAVPAFRFVWRYAEPDGATIKVLNALCGRVPYFGRSTSVAVVQLTRESETRDNLEVWQPSDLVDSTAMLRVPFPGLTDALEAAYDAGSPAWETSRSRGYRRIEPAQPAETAGAPSHYTDFVILRFAGVSPEGRLAVRFTEALRRAVMSRVDDPLPAVLHGHGAHGTPHVAFLALPSVGGPHADGHLLGLAVAVPVCDDTARRRILRGLLSRREEEGTFALRVPGVGSVWLRYEPGLVRPWGLSPERWRRGARRWVSATPVVLDRFPKRGQIEAEVVRSVRTVGLPDPVDVEISAAPLQAGAIRMQPRDLPDYARGRQFRHIAIRFDRVVAGPVLVGAGRYLGIGLLTPDTGRESAQ